MRADSVLTRAEVADPVVNVQVTATRRNTTTGAVTSTQLPTFLIDRNIQGIRYRDFDHLRRVVLHIIDPWHGAPHLQQYDHVDISVDWG
jgi:hypothetical protein